MKFYQYPACSTCKKAKSWLTQQDLLESVEVIHIVDNPPSKDEIKQAWEKSGLDLKKFFNTSGKSYRELNLKDTNKGLTDYERLDLLAKDGKLIKRPLLITEDTALVGFKEDQYKALFSK